MAEIRVRSSCPRTLSAYLLGIERVNDSAISVWHVEVDCLKDIYEAILVDTDADDDIEIDLDVEIETAARRPTHIVVTGNPADGFMFFGPFMTGDDANAWADNERCTNPWWCVELGNP